MYAGASFNAWLGYSGRRVGFGKPDSFHELRDVGRADGAAMAVSRAALERVGACSTSELFAYVEDVDLSLRVRAAGFAVVFVPDAVVRHKGSASTGGSASTHERSTTRRATRSPSPSATGRCHRGCARSGAGSSSARTSRRRSHHPTRAAARGGARGLARRARRPVRSEKLAVDVLVPGSRQVPGE